MGMNVKCSICSIDQPPENFYNKDLRCKACQKLRQQDPEVRRKKNERQRQRYANDPDYRAKFLEGCKEWIANNPEKRKETARNYARRNPEIMRENERRYKATHKLERKNSVIKARKAYPERHQARKRIRWMVSTGKLPRVNTLKCSRCESMAEHYHHHKGYQKPFDRDVIPLCVKCHGLTHRVESPESADNRACS